MRSVRCSSVNTPASYASQLRSCDNPTALRAGKTLHSKIHADGLQADTFLANLLVQMYGKCGNLKEAVATFTAIPRKNAFSYSIMITAYTHHEEFDKAVQLYLDMDDNIVPDDVTNVGVLCACSKSGSLFWGRTVHQEIYHRVAEPGIIVQNALLSMYTKCGSVEEAREIFDRMARRNVISWNAMIAAYARGDASNVIALRLLREMDCEGEKADLYTFCSIIAACSISPRLMKAGVEVHQRVIQLGLETHVVVGTALVTMYGKWGRIDESKAVFQRMKVKNLVSWNAMAAAFAQNGEPENVLSVYQSMDVEPDMITYSTVLAACASAGHLEQGRAVHERLKGTKYMQSDAIVQNAVLNLYSKCGQLDDARSVFESYCSREVTAWNSLISAYSQCERHGEALELFNSMSSKGVKPDAFTFSTVLGTFTLLGALQDGRAVHREIVSSGFEGDDVVQKALVNMYAKCGDLEEARRVFEKIKVKDVVCWTCMILGHSQHGEASQGLHLFRELILQGVPPDYVTYTSVLHACSHEGLVDAARQLLMWMEQDYGIRQSLKHYHCVIDMLSRLGRLGEAEELVKNMPFEYESDRVAWISLMSTCRRF